MRELKSGIPKTPPQCKFSKQSFCEVSVRAKELFLRTQAVYCISRLAEGCPIHNRFENLPKRDWDSEIKELIEAR